MVARWVALAAVIALVACSTTSLPAAASRAIEAANPTARPTVGTPIAGAPAATPSCKAPATRTPEQTEGPFFKSGSPERVTLVEQGMAGTRIVLTGFVLSASCRQVPVALVDFWQADASGNYDNNGFKLRGHQFTDAQGRYRLETIVPGEYPGRTPHIHVKVQAPGRSVLTTQVYFPDSRNNAGDSIFRPELLVLVQRNAGGLDGRFDFVIDAP